MKRDPSSVYKIGKKLLGSTYLYKTFVDSRVTIVPTVVPFGRGSTARSLRCRTVALARQGFAYRVTLQKGLFFSHQRPNVPPLCSISRSYFFFSIYVWENLSNHRSVLTTTRWSKHSSSSTDLFGLKSRWVCHDLTTFFILSFS